MNDRVYIHEFIDIIGHSRANYMQHMTANWGPIGQEERNQLCYGVWALVGSALGLNLVRSAALLKLQPHPKWPRIGPEIRELLRYGSGFTLARSFNYGATRVTISRRYGSLTMGLPRQRFHCA